MPFTRHDVKFKSTKDKALDKKPLNFKKKFLLLASVICVSFLAASGAENMCQRNGTAVLSQLIQNIAAEFEFGTAALVETAVATKSWKNKNIKC